MSAERFALDTNILVYLHDRQAGARQRMARQIVAMSASQDCVLPLQAVTEFVSAATRKRLMPLRDAAAAAEDFLTAFPLVAAGSSDALRAALPVAVSGRTSYWDSLLIATAAEAGCTAIISEDGNPGAVLHGVRIVPPFAGDALSPEVKELLGL
jgi:predicted nucleic acid-binding protein